MRAPIGLRIRNYRKIKGLSQSALAKSVSISPSYLNLIEANKRDIGGALLHRVAAKLEIDLHDLTGESELRLINELIEAFADPLLAPQNLKAQDAHLMVAQLPQLAQALHACFRGYLQASASANAFSNRLQSDPLFSQLLHQMLSRITAIRSMAEILCEVPDVSTNQRENFYRSISDESYALSDVSHTLIAQFDTEVEQHHSVTPLREVNDMIIGQNNYFPDLEEAADKIRTQVFGSDQITEEALCEKLYKLFSIKVRRDTKPDASHEAQTFSRTCDETEKTIYYSVNINAQTRRFQLARQLVKMSAPGILEKLCTDKRLTSKEAKSQATNALASYLASALIFPYDQFLQLAQNTRYDVEALAQHYGASFEQIAHRLVTLRKPDASGIPFGFLRSDPSGYLTKQFPLPGLLMPNAGHACPLWAIYKSLRSPNEVIRQTVSFADGSRYLFIAKTSAKQVASFSDQPVYSAVMLACNLVQADETIYTNGLQLNNTHADTPVGPACNLCVRRNCFHRNSPMASVSQM